jgi:hypothetical protein
LEALPPSVLDIVASREIPGTRRTVEVGRQIGETWITFGDLLPERGKRTRLHPGAGRPREENAARGLLMELLIDRAGLTERAASSVATDLLRWFLGQEPGKGTVRTWRQRG